MTARFLVSTAIAGAAMAVATPALAACEDLTGFALDGGTVTSAEVVAQGAFEQPGGGGINPGVGAGDYGDVPAFCRVQLHLTPSDDSDIRSEVWLPLDGWNGKYVGIGNGIWAGTISYSQMADPLRRGYATASTDTGHTGNGLTAEWAVGHPERLVDFGHRAVHVTTVAAKALVREFYGRGPDLSLWNSCSTGGRQGLMAAHRYPDDFDAISAMAPANPMTDLMVQSMWAGWQPQRFNVSLGPVEMRLVHQAAVAQCDARDGLEDGVIGVGSCDFNPATLLCRPGQEEGCLSGGQVAAMQALYDGVRADNGRLILPGWPRGAEMQMLALTTGTEPFPVAMSYFRDLVFQGRPGWDWRTMDYQEYADVGQEYGGDILNVPPTGLNAYFERGGKLLLSHGLSDGLIPAANTVAFYRSLYLALPTAQWRNQLRLFLAPGMDHCTGGEGPSEFDTLGVIDDWATTDVAPNRILATRPVQAPGNFGGPPPPPRSPMERPLCTWLSRAIYDGEGDPALASSFTCGLP